MAQGALSERGLGAFPAQPALVLVFSPGVGRMQLVQRRLKQTKTGAKDGDNRVLELLVHALGDLGERAGTERSKISFCLTS